VKAFFVKVSFLAVAVVTTLASLPFGDNAILRPVAAGIFVIAALLRQGNDEETILTLATGELLVIAVADASFVAGTVVQCAVLGAAFTSGSAPAGARDGLFVVPCLVACLAGAIWLFTANQVLLPFIVMVVVAGGSAVVALGVQEMRERRRFTGGSA